jgi:hypothetical protein
LTPTARDSLETSKTTQWLNSFKSTMAHTQHRFEHPSICLSIWIYMQPNAFTPKRPNHNQPRSIAQISPLSRFATLAFQFQIYSCLFHLGVSINGGTPILGNLYL